MTMTDIPFASTPPKVELLRYFQYPMDMAASAALTCTSDHLHYSTDAPTQNRLVPSTYKAGHHTLFQHAQFLFGITGVSRNVTWSLLHAHPHYNSSQQSQRYVPMTLDGGVTVPKMAEKEEAVFRTAVAAQFAAYERLIELLTPFVAEAYTERFPGRRAQQARFKGDVRKRAQEVARYVIPIAAKTNLYHLVSGITLYRYWRTCKMTDAPTEALYLVRQMLRFVKMAEPRFFNHVDDPIPLEETQEFQALCTKGYAGTDCHEAEQFASKFDAALNASDCASKLYDRTINPMGSLHLARNAVFGRWGTDINSAVADIMDPSRNLNLCDTLQLGHHSKLMRAMHMASFVFMKKLSHTADSQDQRHRTVYGARPVLASQFSPCVADYVTPRIIRKVGGEVYEKYHDTMRDAWRAINTLLDMDVCIEHALYLLPNAFPIRFVSSSDLLHLHHKWRQRLCLNAQEEIWYASRDEVRQVEKHLPVQVSKGKWIGPPCRLRYLAGEKPFCPEGSRFCGVKVWETGLPEERLI